MSFVLVQPATEIELVVLLTPQHPRQCLPVHAMLILTQQSWSNPIVEFVRVRNPGGEDCVKAAKRVGRVFALRRSGTILLPPAGTSRR
jgi:hypothetical protein